MADDARDGGSSPEHDRHETRAPSRGNRDREREPEPAADRGGGEEREADEDDDRGKRGKKEERKKDKKERRRSSYSRSRSRSRDRRRRSSKERRSSRRSSSRDRDRDRHRSRRDRSNSRSRSDWYRRSRTRSRSPSDGHHGSKRGPAPVGPPVAPVMPLLQPQVAIGPGTGHDPFAALRQQQITPVDPMEIQRMWQEQQLKARQLVLQQQAASAAQAASKTQREIYVGNLMPGAINEVMLTQIFNTALAVRFPGSNVPGMEPVIKANCHSSGKYAFLEFRTPEMATAALDLNGQVQFMGQAISVNRPSGYVDPQKAAVAAAAASQALTAFQRGDLSGLQAAGQQGANLAGLAAAAAGIRPAGLPAGMGIPGVGGVMAGTLAAVGAMQSAAVAQSVAAAMLPGAAAAAAPAAAAPAAATGTTCLCVTGMVTARTLRDDAEYKEVADDLRDECSRHGQVVGVKVPRPAPHEMATFVLGQGNWGKAFVLFADVASAEACKAAIGGRMFAGNTVQVVSVPPETFAMF